MNRIDRHELRAPTWDDLDAAAAVLAADQRGAGEQVTLDSRYLRGQWERFGFELTMDAWVAIDANGKVVAYGQVMRDEDDLVASWGVVHPECRGQGIGSALFEHIEARANELLAGVPDARLRHVVNASEKAAAALLRGRGLQLVRHHWTMSIELSPEVVAGKPPAGISVSSLSRHDDLREIHDVIETAFDEHWCERSESFEHWLEEWTKGPDYDPSLWKLARKDGRLVGALIASALEDQGWVNLLGVRREARGHGIGTFLLHSVFEAFAARGVRSAVVLVDAANPAGATAVYERAGMRAVGGFDLWERTLASSLT